MTELLHMKLKSREGRGPLGLLVFEKTPLLGLVAKEREHYFRTAGKLARIDSPATQDFVALTQI